MPCPKAACQKRARANPRKRARARARSADWAYDSEKPAAAAGPRSPRVAAPSARANTSAARRQRRRASGAKPGKGHREPPRQLARPCAAKLARKPSGQLRTGQEGTAAEPRWRARGLRGEAGVGARAPLGRRRTCCRTLRLAALARGLGSATARFRHHYSPVQTLEARAKRAARAVGSGAQRSAPRRDGSSRPLARAARSAAASVEDARVECVARTRAHRCLPSGGQTTRGRLDPTRHTRISHNAGTRNSARAQSRSARARSTQGGEQGREGGRSPRSMTPYLIGRRAISVRFVNATRNERNTRRALAGPQALSPRMRSSARSGRGL